MSSARGRKMHPVGPRKVPEVPLDPKALLAADPNLGYPARLGEYLSW